MLATLRVSAIVIIGSTALAGCAGSGLDLFGGSSSPDLTTSSVGQTQTTAQKSDPACATLASEIDGLRREGVADRVEKAAARKYTLKPTDIAKANQLNRANADFQTKCSTLPRTAVAPAPADAPAPAAAPAKAPAAKAAAPAKAAAASATKSAAATPAVASAGGTAAAQ